MKLNKVVAIPAIALAAGLSLAACGGSSASPYSQGRPICRLIFKIWRKCPEAYGSSCRSTAFPASFASTTARSRDNSPPCSAITSGRPGSSGTSPKHAQPARKVQTPSRISVSRQPLPFRQNPA